MAKTKTALQKAREAMGFTSRRVAEAIGMDVSGLLRIESGESVAAQDTARRIWAFYLGGIPLGVIYDPSHRSSNDWLKARGTDKQIETLGQHLRREQPELAVRILRRAVDPRRRG